MKLEKILKEFEGSTLNIESLPDYDRAALNVFTNKTLVSDPYIGLTFQHDITRAKETYDSRYKNAKGARFTGYLIWSLVKSFKTNTHFNWRYIDGNWYQFDNLPVYIPIATGGASRFASTFLYHVGNQIWQEFCQQYSEAVSKAKAGETLALADHDIFHVAHNIGNLPHLRFTAMKAHAPAEQTTRTMFYFGQRYQSNGELLMPVSAYMHHANGDPVVLGQLMNTFDEIAGGLPA